MSIPRLLIALHQRLTRRYAILHDIREEVGSSSLVSLPQAECDEQTASDEEEDSSQVLKTQGVP